MYYQFIIVYHVSFLIPKTTLIDMTLNNPIFIFSIITVIWFIPGIVVRRINEIKLTNKKKKNQIEAIQKLYPKNKD